MQIAPHVYPIVHGLMEPSQGIVCIFDAPRVVTDGNPVSGSHYRNVVSHIPSMVDCVFHGLGVKLAAGQDTLYTVDDGQGPLWSNDCPEASLGMESWNYLMPVIATPWMK